MLIAHCNLTTACSTATKSHRQILSKRLILFLSSNRICLPCFQSFPAPSLLLPKNSLQFSPLLPEMPYGGIYNDLSPSKNEIRLIELVATSPRIVCRLSSISLDDSPAFCALSYLWGELKYKKEILVNDCEISITESLSNALLNVAFHWNKAFPDRSLKDFRLWADGICINQMDISEKNSQIPLMKKIYSSAEITLCALGPEPSNIDLATSLDSYRMIARNIKQENFHQDEFEKLRQMFDELAVSRITPGVSGTDDTSESRSREWYTRSCLFEPLRLAYWRRAWVFQELALSENAVIFHRDRSVKLETLSSIAKWAEEAIRKYKPEVSRFDHTLKCLEALAIRNPATLVGFAHEWIMTNSKGPDHAEDSLQMLIPLLESWAIFLNASNPKDHVYALLGVTGLDITPDYGQATSIAAVYIQYCAKQLEMAYQISPAMRYPLLYFLRLAGYANGDPTSHDLPSWVPNFPSCAEKKQRFGSSLFSRYQKQQDPLWSYMSRQVDIVSIRERILITSSLAIAPLRSTTEARDASAESQRRCAISVLRMLHDKRMWSRGEDSQLEDSMRDYSHPLAKLAGAFYCARINGSFAESSEVLKVVRLLQYMLTTDSEGKRLDEVGEAFVVGSDFLQLCLVPGWFAEQNVDPEQVPGLENFMQEISSYLHMHPSQDYSSYDLIEENKDGIDIHGFRLAQTDNYDIALVPAAAREEDQIALLLGCDFPVLIRKVDNYFVYIGPVGLPREIVSSRLKDAERRGESLVQVELR